MEQYFTALALCRCFTAILDVNKLFSSAVKTKQSSVSLQYDINVLYFLWSLYGSNNIVKLYENEKLQPLQTFNKVAPNLKQLLGNEFKGGFGCIFYIDALLSKENFGSQTSLIFVDLHIESKENQAFMYRFIVDENAAISFFDLLKSSGKIFSMYLQGSVIYFHSYDSDVTHIDCELKLDVPMTDVKSGIISHLLHSLQNDERINRIINCWLSRKGSICSTFK